MKKFLYAELNRIKMLLQMIHRTIVVAMFLATAQVHTTHAQPLRD